jgi:hypothetical protein
LKLYYIYSYTALFGAILYLNLMAWGLRVRGIEGRVMEEETVAQPLTEDVDDGGLHLAVAVHLELGLVSGEEKNLKGEVRFWEIARL